MNSPLIDYTRLSPNRHSPRNHAIDRITIHCVVGQLSVEQLGAIFERPQRQASSNYGIGPDGRVGLYVDEGDRSWCSSSSSNDNRAITIEVASDTKDPYCVTPAALSKTVDLCVDICHRHGKKRLIWFGDKEKSLSYEPKADEMVMTVHRWFAKKACPGQYLYDLHPTIAEDVTWRLSEMYNYEEFKKFMKQYEAEKAALPANDYAIDPIQRVQKAGLMVGYSDGSFHPQSAVKREELATILANMLPDR